MKLSGRSALVTGGTRGIGKAVCLALSEAGSDVCVNYLNSEMEAEQVVNQIISMGRNGFSYRADVSNRNEVKAMVEAAEERFGKIDILVNNAGILSKVAHTIDADIDDWHKVLNTNLSGPFYTIKAALKKMRERGYGQIVNISSNTTRRLPTRRVAYTVSKAGLEALTIVLSKEEARFGIRVNAVCPGMINTDLGRTALALRGEEETALFLRNTPMERMGTPEEIAKVVVFLASDDASYITGQIIYVNGGERL